MKRTRPLKRASVVDEQLRALVEEIRREQAALVDLKCSVLPTIREGFRILRLEMLAHERPALPVELCAKLYAAIYRIVGAVPFTALRIIEESTESTVDAVSLREALATVLPKDGMTHTKLTRFLKWDASPEAGPWRCRVSHDRSGNGRMFQVFRHDEK
jgi:hypothetical protein